MASGVVTDSSCRTMSSPWRAVAAQWTRRIGSPVAVFTGHDVVVAGVGADTGGGDAVVAAGTREARHGKLDGGGRHGEDVAVVDGLAVQGQPERISELGGHGADQVLPAFGGAQVVFIPAGPAGG